MTFNRLLLAVLLPVSAAAWLFGCGKDNPVALQTTSVGVDSVGVETTLSPLVFSFSVELDDPAGVQIDYWTDASDRLRILDETQSTSHNRLVSCAVSSLT